MRQSAKRLIHVLLAYLLAPLPRPGGGSGSSSRQLALHWRVGWLRGLLVRGWYGLRSRAGGTRLRCGRRLSVQGSLRLRGSGTVILGDDVIIGDRTDIYTHAPDAVVRIGDRCYLNGSRFGCQQSIDVGSGSMISDARIMDTDFHSIYRERREPSAPIPVAPVAIGKNVWIAAGAAVLKGVTIGDNAVVGFGAVVTHDVRQDRIAVGNPSREIGTVPSIFDGERRKAAGC